MLSDGDHDIVGADTSHTRTIMRACYNDTQTKAPRPAIAAIAMFADCELALPVLMLQFSHTEGVAETSTGWGAEGEGML